MNVYLPNLRLPSAYQEVEYIESSGTQRINTGINVSNDTTYGYECKIMPLSGNSASACPMEMGGTGTDNDRYGITYHLNNAEWQVGFNGGDKGWGTIVSGYGPYSSTEYTIAYNKQNSHTFAIDGTTRYSSFTPSNYYYSNNWNIFCQTYGSTYTRFAWMRLYYMKIYHGSTLVRDFIPCYRKSDSVIGLYDLVNSVFYTNSGTGTFSKGSGVNELKNAYIGEYDFVKYQEVEYIQSSGTQCINTLFNVTKNSKIFVDIQFTSTATQQRAFGVDNGIDGVSMVSYINGSGKYSRYIGNGGSSFTFQATTITADTIRHTFTLDNSRFIITTGGSEVSNTANSQTATNNPNNNQLAILAQNSPTGTEPGYYNYASAKLYACKIWDNDVLVRDFVPCYRKSDGVIGLYDLVNKQFYTNAGTGTFTKGPDVN